MRSFILLLLMSAFAVSGFAQATIRVIPPDGATFAPGQRFDVRIEADNVPGLPSRFAVQLNGRDRTREIFDDGQFTMGPPPNNPAAGPGLLNTGITRRNWSLEEPGRYEIAATVTLSDGTSLTAQSTIEIIDAPAESPRARNIILFIGDGMGVAQRTAARLASFGIENGKTLGRLEMDRMETYGFVMTSSYDALVTDSSPGANGYATGNKSINNAHGVFHDNTGPMPGPNVPSPGDVEGTRLFVDNPRVENIAELLQRTRGMSTGVVSTVAVTDSTPGAFSSHSYSRYAQTTIAEQILESSGHSVILGAGARYFVPPGSPLLGNITSQRADGWDLVQEFRATGFTVVSNNSELQAAGTPQKLLGLFHPTAFATRFDRMRARQNDPNGKLAVGRFPDQPDLEVMTQKAIDVLSQDRDGFFLMVEAGSIDLEYHRMDPHRAVFETIELDKAIGVARTWAQQPGNRDTLILVTADHETSGLALVGVLADTRVGGRAFPDYVDADKDGFPDIALPSESIAFDFPSRFNPPDGNHHYELPRNIAALNPDSQIEATGPGNAGHTAVDVFIGATGPGASLFGGVMDNTEVFFRMLRAVGYQ